MEKLKQLQKDSTAALTSYAWVDKNKGTVRIPVERAMELTMADLASKKPTAAGPIATPAPAAAAASTGATAPSAQPSAAPQSPANATPKPVSVEGPKSEIRGQPTGAANPASAPPGTQPGASATPAASPPFRRSAAKSSRQTRAERPCNHRPEVRCRWPAKLRRHEHFRSDQPNETLRKKCGDDF